MHVSTRTAGHADAAAIALLIGQLGYPTTAAQVIARLQYWSADQRSKVIAAEADGTLAGICAVHAVPLLEHTGWRGRLVALVVDAGFRGHGVGRALMDAAESQARLLGCREMEITSARDRIAAHALYASAGYSDVCDRAARFLKPLTDLG